MEYADVHCVSDGVIPAGSVLYLLDTFLAKVNDFPKINGSPYHEGGCDQEIYDKHSGYWGIVSVELLIHEIPFVLCLVEKDAARE